MDAAPARYAAIARALGAACTGDEAADALLAIEAVQALCERCKVPSRMRDFGVTADAIPRMAKAAMQVQRLLERNLKTVTEADAVRIYQAAL